MTEYGLFLHVAGRQLAPEELFEELSSEARLAESVGFSSCFIAEHHQNLDGHYGSPLMWCAGIAARTSRMRIGTSVLLLPLYHPMHVAEDAAALDVISGGRLILGLGMGYQEVDFAAFEVPVRQRVSRMEEGVEIIRRAWTQDRFSFSGKRFKLEDVTVLPKPVQQPHPPIWLGAMAEQGIERAARIGDALIADPLHNFPTLQRMARLYRDEARRSGRPAYLALRRDAWIAPTRAQALAEYKTAVMSLNSYLGARGIARDLLEPTGKEESEPGQDISGTADERLILGDPAECREQLRRYRDELDVDHFVLRFRHPAGPPHGQVMRAIRDFGEQVIQRV